MPNSPWLLDLFGADKRHVLWSVVMAEVAKLRQENCELRRTKVQLASDLQEEKGLVHNLLGTIKNYEKILRLEESPHCREREADLTDERWKKHDSWGFLYRSIILLDEESSEMAKIVASMHEKVGEIEKLYEHKERKVSNLNMRLERLDAIAFGRKTEC